MEFSKHKKFFLNILLITTFFNYFLNNDNKKAFAIEEIDTKEELKQNKIDNPLNNEFYLLGPGDQLFINFLNNKDFSLQMEIISDGSISLPIIGSVSVDNLTLNETTKKIEDKLSKELLRPEIQLTLIKPRPVKVAIIGEISKPGFYTLEVSETSNVNNELKISGYPTLVSAIQKAEELLLKQI